MTILDPRDPDGLSLDLSDPHIPIAVQRLHQLQVATRWGLNGLLSLITIP